MEGTWAEDLRIRKHNRQPLMRTWKPSRTLPLHRGIRGGRGKKEREEVQGCDEPKTYRSNVDTFIGAAGGLKRPPVFYVCETQCGL